MTRLVERSPVVHIAVAMASVLVGISIADGSMVRVIVALTVGLLLGMWALARPSSALHALLVWLAVLGLVRRVLDPTPLESGLGDVLLLVGPAVLVALFLSRRSGGAPTWLSRAVLVLSLLLAASALNPLQGSPLVGVAGILLVVAPMLAFWVGRGLDARTFGALARTIAVLATAVAAYGLIQTFIAFPPWDEAWLDRSGYTAVYIGGSARAFASFTSASEYAAFLALGIVAWVVPGQSTRLRAAKPFALVILAVALWFESSRGIVVLVVVALGLVLAARRGTSARRALVYGVGALLALSFVAGQLLYATAPTGGDDLHAHQVEGLTDPFGEDSTLPGHLEMLGVGITNVRHDPLGRGVGAVTTAASRFDGEGRGTEADPSNVAVAAGLPGFLAYLAVAGLGLRAAFRVASARRDRAALFALGVVVTIAAQWLNGGQYAVAWLPWLALGWLDGVSTRVTADEEAERVVARA